VHQLTACRSNQMHAATGEAHLVFAYLPTYLTAGSAQLRAHNDEMLRNRPFPRLRDNHGDECTGGRTYDAGMSPQIT
jgi:hypothetical protein